MSIEDPRLSSIDNTSAADDFDSAVEQHLGFSGEAADGFELAQAETPETGRTDRLPAPTPPVQTATATIPTEVTPNADNVVTLPAGIELDNLEFQVDGENLVIVLADGTEIVVIGGAANIPTFVIGDVELPQVALFAALEGSNINIAAGPDGTFAAQGTPEASRNFQDDPIDAGPEQFALADLLGNTDFGDGVQSAEETGDNPIESVPFFIAADEGFVDEDYLDDKIIDGGEGERSFDTAASIGTTAEGSLGIVWGRDDDNSIENGGLTGSAGDRGVAFTEDTIAALTEQNYKSDGRSLIYVLSDNDTTLTAYQDGGDGAPVFRVSVSDVSPNGSYEFELLGNLDHPDTSKEDDITIEFLFRAQDSNGDEGTSRFTVKVNDDSPVQGEAGSGSLTEDDVSEYCATDATSADATTTNAISLGISWGADNDTRGEGDEVGRTVHFVVTDEDGDTGGDGPADQLRAADTTDVTLFTDPASIGLSITGGTFTSGGNVLSYRLTDTVTGGQILTAFYVSTDGEVEREVDVFQIVLDPLTYNGSATVTIFEELDHDLGSSAPIIIDFQFQATDSDGDAALPGTASVTIADDELVVLGPKWPGFVEEEALDGGNEDIRPILVEGAGFLANQGAIDKTISKSLWIQWGADDSNRVENGGYTLGQTAGDRSVVFDLSSEVATPSSTSQVVQSDNVSLTLEEVASFMSVSGKYGTIDLEDLTSGEAELIYELTDNGTVLTAYTGSGEDRADVFRVTLSDIDDGSYTFELLGVLDHPGKAEGAKNEDVLSFKFDFIARDADGDSDGGSFTVKIIDDCPVASATEAAFIAEELSGKDFLEVTRTGTLSFLPGADGATVTGISYGLKNGSGAALVEEPYESEDDPESQPQLTSGGHPVEVTSSEDGLTLEGTDSEGNLVFTLKVTDPATGAYEFKLLAPIDQPDVDQGGTDDVVRLVFNFTVTDGDGDWSTNTLKIEVRDSVPLAANDDGGTVRESAPTPGGNLILAFDVSGSMNSEAVTGDGVSQSRLELAKAAALELLEKADPDALVRIVTFSDGASSTDWISRQDAIDYINNSIPRPGGDTDYDDAIAAIQRSDVNTPGSTVYFFSDGGANGRGQLDSAETAAWERYLSDRGMTSYAVGVGTHLNDNNDDLGDVAWPGTPITITSADDSDLLDTVPTGTALPTTASGNVVGNDSFGADGPGYVKSITVGGVTYSFDGANTITVSGPNAPAIEGKEITVTSPLGGTLTFNFETGAWNYSAPSDMPENTPETAVETFAYTLVDADGDTSSASLSINVQGVNDAPVNSVPSSLTAVEDEFLTINNLSVGDVDAGQADITVKLEVKNGTLTLATTAGLTDFPGNGTSTVTLTGSVAEINDALRGLKYKGLQDFNGTDQLKITTIDNGNTGIGGAKTDVDTVDITVTAVNDAPVNTVPSSQRVDEDEVLTFRSLRVGDVDANGSDITVTLEVAHGKLTLATTSGMRVEGNNSGIVTLTGSVSEINAALNGLKYQGSKDFNGSDQLKITTSDNGNSGTGGIQTDIDTVNITVTSVNDNPEFTGGSQRSFSVDENTTSVGSVSATDVDSPALSYSILKTNDTDWDKFDIDPSSGEITFNSAPNFEDPKDRGGDNEDNRYWIQVQVSDGLGGTSRQWVSIDVKNVNEKPVLTVVSSGAAYTENQLAPVKLMSSASVSDPDLPQNFEGGKVTVTLGSSAVSGDSLVFVGDSSSIRLNGTDVQIKTGPGSSSSNWTTIGQISGNNTTTIEVTLDIDATPSRVGTLLKAIAFATSSENPTNEVRTATVTFNDGANDGSGPALSDSATITINVTPVNDRPVLSGVGDTGSKAYTENGEPIILDDNLTITDVDDQNIERATIQITGNYANGQDLLVFTNTSAITGTFDASNGTLTLTGSASKAAYEAALESVRYVNTSDTPSTLPRTITFTVNDGDVWSVTGQVSVSVTATNDPPTTNDATPSGLEDNVITVSLSGADVDGTVTGFVITSLPQNGTLWLNQNGTGTVSVNQTVGQTLYFKPNPDYNGETSFQYAARDNGTAVDGSPATVTITVVPANDTPDAVNDVLASVDEDSGVRTITFAELLGNDSKGPANEGNQTLTITGVSGAVGGTVAIVDGVIKFTPTANFSGTASFNYTVSDNGETNGASDPKTDTGSVSFAVAPLNDGQASIAISNSTALGQTPKVGDDLQVIVGTDPDGGNGASVTYKWYRGDVEISGATGPTYKLTDADAGKPITVKATYTDGQGFIENIASAPTANVVPGNVAPTGENKTVNLVEDVTYTFKASDFGFQDADGHTFAGITVTPPAGSSAGKLMLGNVAISGTQFVTAEQIAAGMLTWAPADNKIGSSGSTLISFKVRDSSGAEDQVANEISLRMSTADSTDLSYENYYEYRHGKLVLVDEGDASLGVGTGFSNASIIQKDSGTEGINFGDTEAGGDVFTDLSFIRSDNNLEITVTTEGTTRVITVLNQYEAGDTIWERVEFSEGVYAGYNFAGTYNLDTDLNGGNGNDVVAGSSASETLSGGDGRDLLFGNGGNDTVGGGAGDDLIFGGLGNDRITGGAGVDVLTGGVGRDTFVFNAGDSLAAVALTQNNRVSGISGYDVITDFEVGVDKLTLPVPAIASPNATTGIDGTSNSDRAASVQQDERVRSHAVNNGVVTFDDDNTYASALNINNIERLGMAVQYLQRNDMGDAGTTVAFHATLSGVVYTFVYQQSGTDRGVDSGYTLVALQGATIANFNDVLTHSATDPIILDLDKNGFALSSIADGVTFDINADGKADQIAWTSDDGILAYDVDGNGVIDNGSEIFTPDFNGGKFASGVAALASLDGNGDGKIDGSDTAFGELKVWIDANNNGISDEGELSSLSDHGVTSISLTTDQTGGEEDGQTIFAEGEFTFDDGSTGNFVEVGFDTIFGSEPEGLTLHGGLGEVVMTGSAGADTFVFDGTALDDIDVADVITDFSSEEGDVLDVTALLDSLLGEQPDATVETHLRATVDGGNTTVSVQTDANVWKDVVVLQNHDTAIKVLFDDQHATVTPHHD